MVRAVGARLEPAQPIPRANLLVGKLILLQQTVRGCAKKFPHNRDQRGDSLPNCNTAFGLAAITHRAP